MVKRWLIRSDGIRQRYNVRDVPKFNTRHPPNLRGFRVSKFSQKRVKSELVLSRKRIEREDKKMVEVDRFSGVIDDIETFLEVEVEFES